MIAELGILAGMCAVLGGLAFPLRWKARIWWWKKEPMVQSRWVFGFYFVVVFFLWRAL